MDSEDYRDHLLSRAREDFVAERDYSNAIAQAVKHHCRGEFVPEDATHTES